MYVQCIHAQKNGDRPEMCFLMYILAFYKLLLVLVFSYTCSNYAAIVFSDIFLAGGQFFMWPSHLFIDIISNACIISCIWRHTDCLCCEFMLYS